MRTYQATVTSKGQVTIPVAIRRALGMEPRDRVVFILDDTGTVRVSRVAFTVADTYGAVPAIGREDELEEASREAREERAERLVDELREAE